MNLGNCENIRLEFYKNIENLRSEFYEFRKL